MSTSLAGGSGFQGEPLASINRLLPMARRQGERSSVKKDAVSTFHLQTVYVSISWLLE